jgi:Lon protease-like protein
MTLLNDISFTLKARAEEQVPTQIDLPADVSTLKDLDLEAELLAQYKRARRLLAVAEHDTEVPLSQKATALNSISTIITNITKAQTDLYNAERLKTLESTLITCLKQFPDLREEFLTRYREALDVQ